MASRRRAHVFCAATGDNGGEWKQKYDRFVKDDLPKYWKEFRKQAALR